MADDDYWSLTELTRRVRALEARNSPPSEAMEATVSDPSKARAQSVPLNRL